ncbi:MAG: hypothetical protein ABEK17_02960, partial [Candidatus Aenigmatarchaeota archaeon]
VRYEDVEVEKLRLVTYTSKRPRDRADLFDHIDISEGISEGDIEDIRNLYSEDPPIQVGLTSKLAYKDPCKLNSEEAINHEKKKYAHIPMVDFDLGKLYLDVFEDWNEDELLDLMVKKIKDYTDLDKGAILDSSSNRNYHMIGIGKLMPEEVFINFISQAGSMKYKLEDEEDLTLADERHLFHSLNPLARLAKIGVPENRENDWSPLDYTEKFSTLRISPKALIDEDGDLPEIIRVFE